jgi:ADP-ribosylglycohydrolase
MTVDVLRPTNRHDECCQRAVPLHTGGALEAVDVDDTIRSANSIGGDTELLEALCGSVDEACLGHARGHRIRGLGAAAEGHAQGEPAASAP